MKLEGSLDAFSLPDIFQLLSFTKKSGGLRLSNPPASGVVYFTDGLVTGASADGSRQALARRLIGSGVLDDATLAAAVEAASTGGGIGPWLAESGAVDVELIRQAATEQIVDAVFDLLRWTVGEFAFQIESANPDDVGVRLAADAVVTEATQRQDSWSQVSAVISGPDTLLTMPVVVGSEPSVSRDEWALLALVDGRRRVGDLVELTGCGQYAVVSTLAGLVTRGLLQVPGEDDHVSTVLRRQTLLAPLEAVPGEPTGETADDVHEPPAQEAVEEPAESDRPHAEEPSDDGRPAQDTAEDTPESTDPEDVAGDADTGVVIAAVQPATGELVTDEDEEQDEDETTSDEAPQPVPLLGRAHVPGNVVPPRPEPFLPSRRPDHPEPAPVARLTGVPSMAQPMVGATAVAAEPETAGLIERDPSVNRSLLLRLIAGVRGL